MAVQDRYKTFAADQRRYYDELITEDWDTYFDPCLHVIWRFEVARLMARVRPARVLNMGCGCGFHDLEMAKRPWIERIDSIDYSERSIEKAEGYFGHPKVHRQVADFLEFQPDEPYDLVVSFQVIEHLEDPVAFLARCRECCRPDGHVALFTVDRMRPYNRIQARYGKPPVLEDPMHKQEFTADELRDLGVHAGLEPTHAFSYAISRLRKPFLLSLWVGYLFPSRATRLAAIFRNPGKET